MSDNSGSCKIVKFAPLSKINDNLSDFAENFFDVVSIDYTNDGLLQLTGYLPDDADEQALDKAAKQQNIILPAYEWSKLSSKDWLTENVIKFKPVETKDFMVYGVHEKEVDLKNKIGIKVYAATAFGSEHQTTQSCLNAISDIANLNKNVQKILDVGTGSGILAIGAAKLWPNAQIVAVDIDNEAVNVAKNNAADNQVAANIEVGFSDGYASALVSKNSPYDVILANILARPLIAMAQDLAKNLQKGGFAVISGFVEDQLDWVVNEHKKHGLTPKKVYCKDNWRTALLEKE